MTDNQELKKDYELAFLVNVAEAGAGVFEVLRKCGATLSFQSPINQIRLTYPIKKQLSAFFGYCHFSAAPEAVSKIKSELNLMPAVPRFLIITPPLKPAVRQAKPAAPSSEAKPKPELPVLSNEALEEKLEEILK